MSAVFHKGNNNNSIIYDCHIIRIIYTLTYCICKFVVNLFLFQSYFLKLFCG
jgi:hypothetical protein